MSNVICMICGGNVRVNVPSGDLGRTHEQIVTEVSDISGRSLRQMISTVFPQDFEIQQLIHDTERYDIGKQIEFHQSNSHDGMCGTCYNLLEQVINCNNRDTNSFTK